MRITIFFGIFVISYVYFFVVEIEIDEEDKFVKFSRSFYVNTGA